MAGFAGWLWDRLYIVIWRQLFLARTNLIMDKMQHCSCGSARKSKLSYRLQVLLDTIGLRARQMAKNGPKPAG